MIDVYPWFRLLGSLLIVGVGLAHAVDAAWAKRRYHDDRASIEWFRSLVLLAVGLGLLISATASFLVSADVAVRQEVRNFGLAMATGAMLVHALVFLVADRHRPTRGER